MALDPEEYRLLQVLLGSAAPTVDFLPAVRDWLLQAGAVQRLAEDSSDEAIRILEVAARSCPAPAAVRQGLEALHRLARQASPSARVSLFRLALECDLPEPIEWIQSEKIISPIPWQNRCFAFLHLPMPEYQAVDPNLDGLLESYLTQATPAVRTRLEAHANDMGLAHWREIAESLLAVTTESLTRMISNFPGYTQFERASIRRWLAVFAENGSLPAQIALCELFLSHDDSASGAEAVRRRYLPGDPERKALFLFITEQWEAYEVLDFTHLQLNQVYETASTGLRQRILSHSRLSGHTEWLQSLGEARRRRWLKDMTDADWRTVISQLETARQWPETWRMVAYAPPQWSAVLVNLLDRSGWQPDSAADQQEFLKLVALARQATLENAKISPQKMLKTPAQDIQAVAVRSDGKAFATGGSDQRLYLWDLPSGDRRGDLISSPTPAARALALSPDGLHLAAAFTDQSIRIFRLEDNRLVKTLEGHSGLIRSLFFHPDERTLFSASFDGTLRAWRFPLGPEYNRLQPEIGELFAAAGNRNLGSILLAGTAVQVLRWPQGGLIHTLPSSGTTLLLSPAGQVPLLAGYSQDRSIRIWNISNGRLIQQIDKIEAPLGAISLSPRGDFLLGGDRHGRITIWNTSTGETLETMQVHEQAVVALHWPSDNLILSASQDGRLVLWDARLLHWLRQPTDQLTREVLKDIQAMAADGSITSSARAWLVFLVELLRWKNRYDILLEEPRFIHLDAFDIEL